MATTRSEGVILQLTERCNSRCIMCDSWRLEVPKSLDASDVVSFWRRRVLRRKHSLALTGGEPLLHPALFTLADRFRDDVDHLVLSTNGVLLGESAAEAARIFDKILVSVDGATPETFRAVRGIDSLDRVLQSVEAVRRVSPRPRIIFKMTVQRRNFREIPGLFELAVATGASGVALTVPDLHSGVFCRFPGETTGRQHAILLDREECSELRDVATATRDRFADRLSAGFLVEGDLEACAAFFDRAADTGGPLPPRSCDRALIRIVVTADGLIRPCFFLEPIGHLSDPGEGDYFDSAELVEFRRRFDPASHPACRSCGQFVEWRF